MLHYQNVMIKNNKSILMTQNVSLNKQCFRGEIQRYIFSAITVS